MMREIFARAGNCLLWGRWNAAVQPVWENPGTGDVIMRYVTLMAVSAVALIVVLVIFCKRKK